MRRVTAAIAAVACLATTMVLAGATAAGAQPTPTVPAEQPGEGEIPEPEPGTEVCTITDYRLVGLSGLVATDDGYIVINDSAAMYDERLPIFFLDHSCQVVDFQTFYPGRPLDPEDLAYDYQRQVLWVADIGDNEVLAGNAAGARPTVALWQVDLSGGDRTPVIHRFSYPDGPRDSEALLLDGDGTPLIVTKTVGPAEVYRPAGELVPNNPPEQAIPLEKVGEVNLPETDSEHEFLPAAAARRAITGGAVAPDGSRVVLRTYTDAFEFDVPDGDVVTAVTEGEPRITPLPGEPFGEAITYSPDGELFLTVSDLASLEDPEIPTVILSYVPTPPAPPAPPETPAEANAPRGGGFSLVNGVQDIINLIAAAGVVGLLLVAAGVYGIVRARRRAASAEEDDPGPITGRARLTDTAADSAAEAGEASGGGVYTSRAARGGDSAEDEWYESGQSAGEGYADDRYRMAGEEPPTGAGGTYSGGTYTGGTYAGGTYTGGRYAEGGHPPAPASGYGEDPGYHDGQPRYPTATGYGYADGVAGQEYGYADPYGRGGTPDQPFDQDWPEESPAQPAAAYPDQGYPAHGYPGHGYAGYPDQGGGYPDQGGHGPDGYPAEDGQRRGASHGTYASGGYESGAPDYYSDDPDYPYEFRGR